MKILLTAMSLGAGGAETHIVELASALKAHGDEVFVASRGGIYEKCLSALGIPHVRLPLDSKSAASIVFSRAKLTSLIRREGFDIVHAHARIPAFICAPVAKKLGVRFVTTAHGMFDVTPVLRRLTDWGEHCFAVSDDIAAYLRKNYNYATDKITLVPNGIDTEAFSQRKTENTLRKSLSIAENQKIILHVSRLDEASSLCALELIKSAEQVCAEKGEVTYVIVGGGTEYKRLHALAEKVNRALGRPGVIMPGVRSDIASFLSESSVFVGPSRAAMEAMSAGVPTVVSGSQGHIGLFSEKTEKICEKTNFCGRGLPLPDSDTLGDEILSALALGNDERKALVSYERKYIEENYSAEKMAEIYIKKYAEIAKIKTGSRHDVTLCGYYGFDNIGDEAMAKSIVRMLRDENPSCNICVMSQNPKRTARELCVTSVGRMNLPKIKKTLKNSRVFIFGGGNLLQDKTSTLSMIYYTKMLTLAKKCGCEIRLVANGIGPIIREKNRLRAAKALSLADCASMRDKESQALFSLLCPGKTATLVPDPVLHIKPSKSAMKILGIECENYFVVAPKLLSREGEEYLLEMIENIKARTGLLPVFVAMHRREDTRLCKRLAARTSGKFINEPLYAEEIVELLSGSEFSLCSRLHALVLSRAAGISTAAFTDDGKLTSFMEGAGFKKTIGEKYTLISDFEI